MKTIDEIIRQIENENSGLKIAKMGLSIINGNDVVFCNSLEDLKEALQNIDTTNLYNIDVKFSKWMFLQITVTVSYLTGAEISEPFNVVKIARNINAFDVNFQHIDDGSKFDFWNKLYNTIQSKIDRLNDTEISSLKKLTNENITSFNVREIKNVSQKSKVFTTAWQLVQKTNKTFAVCLSMAWNLYRLRKKMKGQIVKFAFEKADGTLRSAKGTLQNVSHLIKGTGQENLATFKYYDIDASAFRSFKIENLITIL